MKKLFTFFLALAATTSLFAAGTKIGNLYYNLNESDKTAEVTYQYYNKAINYSSLTTANIPETVTSESVTYTVTSIGQYAFWQASKLQSVTIPKTVTTLSKRAFSACPELQTVVIGDGVDSIGDVAFSECEKLNTITFGESLKSFGDNVLRGDSAITTVYWNAIHCKDFISDVTPFYRYDTDLGKEVNIGKKITSFTFGPKVEYIPACLCQNLESLNSVTMSNSVTGIGELAFFGCESLESVNLSNSLTAIDEYVFSDCYSLNSITIPDNVTKISAHAFAHCESLSTVTIGKNVATIDYTAFDKCYAITTIHWNAIDCAFNSESLFTSAQVTSFSFGNEVKRIPDGLCSGMYGLTSVTFPNSLESIGDGAFFWTSLTDVLIPENVKEIKGAAFAYCMQLTKIDVAAENTYFESVDGVLFDEARTELIQYPANKAETAYTIPEAVKTIWTYSFSGCKNLISVVIPNNVETIEKGAFAECVNLTTLTIGSGVNQIDQLAFFYCKSLASVTCHAVTPPALGGNEVFSNVDCSKVPLYVPAESVEAYKAADQWKEFNPIEAINAEGVNAPSHQAKSEKSTKVIRDGQVLIVNDNKLFNLHGAQVK